MPVRTRNRNLKVHTGRLYYGSSLADTRTITSTESNSDVVGSPQKDNDFHLLRKEFNGGIITGTSFYRYDNYPSVIASVLNDPATLTSTQALDFRNRLFANTGPLTPKVHLPIFIFELREIPMMLKHAGDLLHKLVKAPTQLSHPREIGASTLAYQFGWKPLIEDIGKLSQFMSLVNKKQEEMKRANSSRGLTKRISLGNSHSSSLLKNKIFNSYVNGTIKGDYIQSSRTETWGTCRWKQRDNQMIGRTPDLREAFDVVFALRGDYIPINVWKTLPWSWLIDWFADLSNGLQASYNMINYRPVMGCIMQRSETSTTSDALKQSGLSMSAISNKAVRKQRFAIPLDSVLWPTLRLPFLDNFKLSILGGLAATRIGWH